MAGKFPWLTNPEWADALDEALISMSKNTYWQGAEDDGVSIALQNALSVFGIPSYETMVKRINHNPKLQKEILDAFENPDMDESKRTRKTESKSVRITKSKLSEIITDAVITNLQKSARHESFLARRARRRNVHKQGLTGEMRTKIRK